MASNSIRERLILADKVLVSEVYEIKTVKRSMQQYSDLKNFAVTQLPLAAVVGKLPVVVENKFVDGQVAQCRSDLRVDIYVYFLEKDREKMDIRISALAEDIWVKVYENPTRSGLCHFTTLKLSDKYGVFDPFVAFNLIVNHQYIHSPGGI